MDFVYVTFMVHLLDPSMVYLQSLVLSYDTSDGPLKKGIIFHEDKKFLLAEKFVNVQFLLPFPAFGIQIQTDIKELTTLLETMWDRPTYKCDLDYTNLTMKNFNIDWLVNEVQKEIDGANVDLAKLHSETAFFLAPMAPQDKNSGRPPRAVPVAAAAPGAIGLFGAGISMGPGSCGRSGIFGNSQSAQNADDINRLFDLAASISANVQQVNEQSNEKFYIVSEELKTLQEIQDQMRDIQNANWKVISDQLEAFRSDVHLMRNCDQFLFSRQQINFNFDTVSSLLSLFYANVKSYRAAFFAYQVSMLNSIPVLLNKYVPMPLLSKDSLEVVLDKVAIAQTTAMDRLTLAMPFQELLSYYEAKLLQDVLTLRNGLLLTMSIPLASRRTVMTTYQALPLPMPQIDDADAIMWEIEADYLAVSEDGRETALITSAQMDSCVGASQYSICHEGLATEGVQSSCLSLLFFGNLVQAMKVCNVKPVVLPTKERAISLRYGIWLIMSASPDYTLTESFMNSSTPVGSSSFPGCRICVITLACERQISGPNIRIRSDLQSCSTIPPTIMNVDLPVPLASVLFALPPLNESPMNTTKGQANIQLLESIKDDTKYLSPASSSTHDALHEIAKPVALKMTAMKTSYTKRFNTFADFKTTLFLGITSFLISMALHILITFLYHIHASIRHLFHFTHKDHVNQTRLQFNSILTVEDDHFQAARSHLKVRARQNVVLSRTQAATLLPRPEPAQGSASAPSGMSSDQNDYEEVTAV